jgi:hypothetical protein
MSGTLLIMRRALLLAVLTLVLAACGGDDDATVAPDATTTTTSAAASATITVTTSAFENGSAIPVEYTCDGEQKQPELEWSGEPEETQAIAITVVDPDAGGFQHWIRVGDVDGVPWQGPCPPDPAPHHYVFTVHALDSADVEPTLDAITSHTIVSGSIIGVYSRDPAALAG